MEDMLNRNVSKEFGANKAQINLVYVLIGIFIALVVGFALLPSIVASIASAGLTGAAGVLADLIPLFVVILLILAVVAFYR